MTASRFHPLARRAAATLLALLLIAATSDWAFAQSAAVRLVIDYGDGAVKIFTDLPWSKGTTVLDQMNAAQGRPHGITFKHTGTGATALLTQIDDVANEGGGTGKKNWQFWVNTTYADRGFGAYEVQAFDVVFWRFTTQQGK